MDRIEIAVPDGERGKWKVETFVITEKEAAFSRLRETVTGGREQAVEAGTYKRLTHGWDVVMSNTAMEVRTHAEFINEARGDVLINGLGLGMALGAILQKPEVRSVTVIEQSEDVIALVAPTYLVDPRVQVHCANAFEWEPPAGARFDVVWHDIWTYISAENLKQMKSLEDRFADCADWQGSWAKSECQALRRTPARRRSPSYSM